MRKTNTGLRGYSTIDGTRWAGAVFLCGKLAQGGVNLCGPEAVSKELISYFQDRTAFPFRQVKGIRIVEQATFGAAGQFQS